MKRFISTAILGTLSAGVVCAQGTIDFRNFYNFFAPDYLSDGTTKLSGSQYMAELLAGPSAGNLAFIATTSFLTGNSAGYFDGGTQMVPNVQGGATAFVQVDIWNTAIGLTFGEAHASGLPNAWAQSSVFPVTTGSPDGGVPTLPGILTGLTPMSLNAVPEPSTLVLAGLGIASLIISLKRRS